MPAHITKRFSIRRSSRGEVHVLANGHGVLKGQSPEGLSRRLLSQAAGEQYIQLPSKSCPPSHWKNHHA
jgi:hypothetical protein